MVVKIGGYFVLAFFIFAPVSLFSQKFQAVNSTQAREIINNNDYNDLIIIDARQQSHFIQGHIPNALNIDPYISNSMEKLGGLDTTATYLIYCRTRNRIFPLIRMMDAMGFENVFVMTDGWVTWSYLGYETEVPELE